jgi:hypothetical protein
LCWFSLPERVFTVYGCVFAAAAGRGGGLVALGSDILIVTATIDPSVEEAWNEWYDSVHLPEIVACPGFRSAQRYVAEDKDGARSYISIYELSDPAALGSAEFAAKRGWGAFQPHVRFKTLQYARIAQLESA